MMRYIVSYRSYMSSPGFVFISHVMMPVWGSCSGTEMVGALGGWKFLVATVCAVPLTLYADTSTVTDLR